MSDSRKRSLLHFPKLFRLLSRFVPQSDKKMVNPDLPKDIMVEIFLRLPTKSVGRCRCLSKTWATDLNTHKFVSSHRAFRSREENILLLNSTGSLETLVLPMKDNNITRSILPHIEWGEFLGSCNGLVLLRNMELDMFLVNPITLQHVAIPNSYLLNHNIRAIRCGFGYDSSTDDYKVLTVSYMSSLIPRLDVFSVRTGSWRRINSSPVNTFYGLYDNGVFINSAVHWYSNSRALGGDPSEILAFDLGSEVFRKIPAPMRICANGISTLSWLCVLEGCLCMVETGIGAYTVYIMKEYGKASSWTKLSVDPKGQWNKPLCFIGDKELLLETIANGVVVYNIEDATTRRVVANGKPTAYESGVVFTESLVSPNEHAAFLLNRETRKWFAK